MFNKAQRKKAKLRLSIAGLSGSGKTWSALEIATGMGGKIALIDTEAGRGELYGENFNYDTAAISAPFSPEKYIEAIKKAELLGYDILIIDSLSHAWVGDGGVLSIAEKAGGGFQTGWKDATPKHNALVEAIIQSKMHIIVTMRSKADYVVELNEKGKHAPRKVGLAPVQRDGLEYEMTMAMDINHQNIAHITKDNTQLYNQQYIKPTKEMGAQLMEWLNTGIDLEKQFQEVMLPEIIEQINATKDDIELKTVFTEVYKKYGTLYEKSFEPIITAKDKRKLYFMEMEQMIGVA